MITLYMILAVLATLLASWLFRFSRLITAVAVVVVPLIVVECMHAFNAHYIAPIGIALLVAMWLLFKRNSDDLIRAENTANPLAYDAAVETHHDTLPSRTMDAALATRHLLVKKGSTDVNLDIAGAGDLPLGTVDNIVASGEKVALLLLGKGYTKKMVASAAIGVGAECFTSGSGKVSVRPSAAGTYWYVGTALSAAGADGDLIEVNDCQPVQLVIAS